MYTHNLEKSETMSGGEQIRVHGDGFYDGGLGIDDLIRSHERKDIH